MQAIRTKRCGCCLSSVPLAQSFPYFKPQVTQEVTYCHGGCEDSHGLIPCS